MADATVGTNLGDIVQPAAISRYMKANLPDVIAFVRSGAAIIDPNGLAAEGGSTITMRHFAEDTTDSELDDGSASADGQLSSWADVAVVTRRKRVRGVDDAIKAALGTGDANAVNNELARQSTYYWGKQIEKSGIAVLTGLFDASSGVLRTTHRNAIATSSATRVSATYNDIIDTRLKLGDNGEKLSIMLVHSKVWADLKKENATAAGFQTIEYAGGQTESFPTYDGAVVIVTDQFSRLTLASNYYGYATLLIAPGAMAFMIQREMSIMVENDASKVRTIIAESLSYAPHVFGYK